MVLFPALTNIPVTEFAQIPKLAMNDAPSQARESGDGSVFADLFGQLLNDVNRLQLQANQLGEDFILGKHQDVAALVLATQKADLALDLTIQVRNKLVEAYQEVMRMQV